jgi:hypothetical protein
MLIKSRTKSIKIKKLEVLQRRLIYHHPKTAAIEDELGSRLAGHYGEQSTDYFLKPIEENGFYIFNDLRLPSLGTYFQIDTLLISSRYLLILEVKNISGTLNFDHLNQVIRIRDDGMEESFSNPIFQVKRQHAHLIDWLSQNHIPPIPVHFLVVMSNPKTIIKAPPANKEVRHIITHSPYLQERVKEFQNRHTAEKLTKRELTKLSKLLVRAHTPENPDLLSRFQIAEKDIIKGVYCTTCLFLPVNRKKGSWHCPKCLTKSNDLHLYSLMDYTLLYGTAITNKQCCDFLRLPSRHVAKRLLSEMNLPQTGVKKGTIYTLPSPE